MNRVLLVLLVLVGSATAAPAAGREDFLAACLKAGGETSVCTCKAGAAVQLLSAHMLDLVILSMRDPARFTAVSQKGGLTHEDNVAWTDYIRDSNKACHLSY